MATKQSTFGTVAVNKYTRGKRTCDECTGMKENGEPKRCGNTAKYAIMRNTGLAEFYCAIHARDTWKEMANE